MTATWPRIGARTVKFVILILADILLAIWEGEGALAVPLAILELPDILPTIWVDVGAGTVPAITANTVTPTKVGD